MMRRHRPRTPEKEHSRRDGRLVLDVGGRGRDDDLDLGWWPDAEPGVRGGPHVIVVVVIHRHRRRDDLLGLRRRRHPEVGRRREAGDEGPIEPLEGSGVEELVDVVLLRRRGEHVEVRIERVERVRRDGARGGRRRRADAGEARVAAPDEAFDRRLEVRERERDGRQLGEQTRVRRRRAGRPREAVGPAIAPQKRLVRFGRADDVELGALADVGHARLLERAPQHVGAFLFVGFVLGRAGLEVFPRLVGLAARGIHVDRLLARRADRLVEDRRDEVRAEVLRVLHRAVPRLDDEVRGRRFAAVRRVADHFGPAGVVGELLAVDDFLGVDRDK
mmetsp:Transcript_11220/g.45431  ORF Transcript_11220/g.45431 Transcript_11220/m.45431 type:complete len:332 (+) Transcript_11220:1397-2392(+)